MSVDLFAQLLIFAMVIPATLGPILYGFTAPWYKSHVGRALFVSWTGLGLLVDVSAAYALFGDQYPGRDAVRLFVFSLVAVGLWYKLIALLLVRRREAVDE